MDFGEYVDRQATWSQQVFGPGPRTRGIVEHLREELEEVLADPTDLEEWADLIILASDGAWRAGFTGADIERALLAKQEKNFARKFPDLRSFSQDQKINHIR